jgi:hypothetical protein
VTCVVHQYRCFGTRWPTASRNHDCPFFVENHGLDDVFRFRLLVDRYRLSIVQQFIRYDCIKEHKKK